MTAVSCGVLAEMIKKGMADIIITTCGTLDHDLARAWGGKYMHGAFELDDAKLHKEGVNRLGNVLVPNESYGEPLEEPYMVKRAAWNWPRDKDEEVLGPDEFLVIGDNRGMPQDRHEFGIANRERLVGRAKAPAGGGK